MSEREDEPQDAGSPSSSEPEVPPFDPDPRLITYLERGRRPGEQTVRQVSKEPSDDKS